MSPITINTDLALVIATLNKLPFSFRKNKVPGVAPDVITEENIITSRSSP